MFAIFTPVTWSPDSPVDEDLGRRPLIVSLTNAHRRPFRLQLRAGQEQHATQTHLAHGARFGFEGNEVALMSGAYSHDSGFCSTNTCSFELDAEAERKADLPPLSFAYDKTLLSGVDDGRGDARSHFICAELECYELEA